MKQPKGRKKEVIKMKTYIYTTNGFMSTGTHTIEANNKKEAIEKAKEFWGWKTSVNVSSFKVKK